MKPYDPSEIPAAAPRFIPTLTEVVEFDGSRAVEVAAADPTGTWDTPTATDLPPEASTAPENQPPSPSDHEAPVAFPVASEEVAPQLASTAPVAFTDTAMSADTGFATANEEKTAATANPEPAEPEVIEHSEPKTEASAPPPTSGEAQQPPIPLLQLPEAFTDALVHTIMQKVDFVLAERIKDTVNLVIEQQTRALIPQLREELEFTVRRTIDEATSDALLEILDPEKP